MGRWTKCGMCIHVKCYSAIQGNPIAFEHMDKIGGYSVWNTVQEDNYCTVSLRSGVKRVKVIHTGSNCFSFRSWGSGKTLVTEHTQVFSYKCKFWALMSSMVTVDNGMLLINLSRWAGRWWHKPLIPSGGRSRWISGVEASLVYTASSRTIRASQRNPI